MLIQNKFVKPQHKVMQSDKVIVQNLLALRKELEQNPDGTTDNKVLVWKLNSCLFRTNTEESDNVPERFPTILGKV
jgi:hypothetical protein